MKHIMILLLIFSPLTFATLLDQDQGQEQGQHQGQHQGQGQGQHQGQSSNNHNLNANLNANRNSNHNHNRNSANANSQSASSSNSSSNANGLGVGIGIGKGGEGGDGGNAKSKSNSYSEGSISRSNSEGGDADSRSKSYSEGGDSKAGAFAGGSESGVDFYQGDTILSTQHEYEAVAEAVSSLNLPACGDGAGAGDKNGSFNLGGVAYICEIEMEIQLQLVSIAAEIAGAKRSKDPEIVQYHLNNAHLRIEDIKASVAEAHEYVEDRSHTASFGAWFRDTWWVIALLAIGL